MNDDTPDPEHVALLAAIGRALGWSSPYVELHGERAEALHLGTLQQPPAGESIEVLGGAVEPVTGRVAWIEERSGTPQDGHVPVSIHVHVAWGGQQRSAMEVPTYNPYFGCRVRFIRWFGDSLVFIYREKHRTLAARMAPPYDGMELVEVGSSCTVDGDTAYFVSQRPGLLQGWMLPSLAPALPLPVPSSAEERVEIWQHAPGALALAVLPPFSDEDDGESYRAKVDAARAAPRALALPTPEARALGGSPDRVGARMRELLTATAPPLFGVDVLVGAVATPFWRDEALRGTHYAAVSRFQDSPQYLPVYWYRHLVAEGRTAEAEAWRAWLERVAALEPVDAQPWTPGESGEELVARTALAYLRFRSVTLAETCRTGKLPEGERCYFFARPEARERLVHDESYPPEFREVLRQVASRNPKSLSQR